ncbi:hypothetical protein SIID45300_01223 [Candidatus Magnetaquicoccaceae bacterium FCR-1]|uniref:RelA/SpoT domain-containing protein n=1 Tax=Candidatus Magnetaquiglobus chichijimensis TaxID=3141448 RepID=A0ABQ0C7P3_9PROT
MSNPLNFPNVPDFSEVVGKITKKYQGNSLKELLEKEIGKIEETIVHLRTEGCPIYSTKGRVKSEISIFLKSRRKMKPLNEQTDYVGLRVLVMFDEELLETFKALLRTLIRPPMLREVTVFNMPDMMRQIITSKELVEFVPAGVHLDVDKNPQTIPLTDQTSLVIKSLNKGTGYRSIHLLFARQIEGVGDSYKDKGEAKDHFLLELQLRSLLDDVWGEMEHRLAYKQGMANPQIVSSFAHFKDDLRTMGKRLAELNTLKSRHNAVDSLSIQEAGPYLFLGYEQDWDPEFILDQMRSPKVTPFRNTVRDLLKCSKDFSDKKIDEQEYILKAGGFVNTAESQFENCAMQQMCSDKIKYHLLMEKNYLKFLKKDKVSLQEVYHDYELMISETSRYKDRPVPHFRFAEVAFVLHRIVEKDKDKRKESDDYFKKALQEFDKAIRLVEKTVSANDSSVDPMHYRVGAAILNKVVSVYELIGSDEYLDYCMRLSELSMALLDRIPDGSAIKPSMIRIRNNAGWLQVEKFRSLPVRSVESSAGDDDEEENLCWHGKCFDTLEPLLRKLHSSRPATSGEDKKSSNPDGLETSGEDKNPSHSGRPATSGEDKNTGKSSRPATSGEDKITSNEYDTAAWFLFQTWIKCLEFKEKLNIDLWGRLRPEFKELYRDMDNTLRTARIYCRQVWIKGENEGVFVTRSLIRQRIHTELIMDPQWLTYG